MTMFRQLSGGYGGGYEEGFGVMRQLKLQGYDFNYYYNSCNTETCLGSDLEIVSSMAEGESSLQEGGGAESSSKEERDDKGWLQLSIGNRSHDPNRKNGSGLVELELLPTTTTSNNKKINDDDDTRTNEVMRPLAAPIMAAPRQVMSFNPPFFFPQYQYQYQAATSSSSIFPRHQQQQINWGFRPLVPMSIPTGPGPSSSSSSSTSSLMGPRPPFHLFPGVEMPPGPSLDFRVIPPPRRPHSGIWFMLQALQFQEREPFLPQVSKSYLRIKDGRMTIRVVIKYLVNKLKLGDESEVEITCKGQKLVPFLTVQHVRDNIWSPRDNNIITLLPNSSTTQHIMVLHYGRNASN